MISDKQGRSGINGFDLSGKVALVTGAGRGLGRAIALGLASAGAKMVLASRNPRNLQNTADTIREHGGEAHVTSVDISVAEQCSALMTEVERIYASLDILVCNAATNIQGPAADMVVEQWRRVIETELSGYYYLSRAAYPLMARQKSGSIIMVSANSSIVGYADLVGVSTAKGGIDMMARNLAVEWGTDGIRVNTINPGWTDHVPEDGADVDASDGDLDEYIRTTTPLERRGQMAEFAFPAIFLASTASSYITGQNIVVDGGYCIK